MNEPRYLFDIRFTRQQMNLPLTHTSLGMFLADAIDDEDFVPGYCGNIVSAKTSHLRHS